MFVADHCLTPDDVKALAAERGASLARAEKVAHVSARPAAAGERVETRWNGVETVNTAQTGDWIVASLDRDQRPLRDKDGFTNTYIVKSEDFDASHERVDGQDQHGAFYRPRGEVVALYLPDGFDIVAPWGERQRADRGYLIVREREVYGNHAETFERTYRTLGEAEL